MRFLLAVVIGLSAALSVVAFDKWPLSVPKDSTVIVKIPPGLISDAKWSIWRGRFNYSVTLSVNPDGRTAVNGDPAWADKGWPWMTDWFVKEIERDGNVPVIVLRRDKFNRVLLRLDPSVKDVNKVFQDVVHVGSLASFESSDYYRQTAVGKVLPTIFSGPLGNIPQDVQLRMLKGLAYNSNLIGGETFKSKFYIMFRQVDDTVYNTNRVNQAERVARAVEKILSFGVKEVGGLKFDGIEGLKIEFTSFYRDFTSDADPQHSEVISVYFTFDQLMKYKEADITNQQLIDASFVFVNGNRVQVSLTQFQ